MLRDGKSMNETDPAIDEDATFTLHEESSKENEEYNNRLRGRITTI